MKYRNIYIANKCYLSRKNNCSVRYLVITEKQYESMEVLVGELKKEEDPITPEQLTLYYITQKESRQIAI